jgi:photosynthetic reaction center cytochrome c subunit
MAGWIGFAMNLGGLRPAWRKTLAEERTDNFMGGALIFRRITKLFVLLLAISPVLAAQQQSQAPAQPRTAEQQFKNIKVLQGIPADQVVIGMHVIEESLGVNCEYCHVANDFPKDNKELKETARKMIRMVMDLNKNSFSGNQTVTCYTCHRGSPKPAGVLALPDTTSVWVPYGTEPQVPPLPSVDQILANYVRALGGEQAIRKVTSRVITATRDVPTGPGGTVPMPAQMEQYVKAPNLVSTLNRTPTFSTSEGFDGTTAWVQNMTGMVSDAPAVDLARDKRSGGLYEALTLKQEYSRIEVQGLEKVNGRDAYLVVGFPQADSPERLYFDASTGLLLRKTTTLATPFGSSPFEVDYDDYRDSGSGVKMPFWIRMIPATPRSAMASRSSIRIQKVQDNVTVDSSKFSKPQPRAASAQP